MIVIDIQSVTAIASLVVGIIGLFPRKSRDQTKEQKEAIAAVADAYYTTGQYLESRETHPQDREHEWEIAQKWDNAARLLQPFDPEGRVYQRLNLKSRFWIEGQTGIPSGSKAPISDYHRFGEMFRLCSRKRTKPHAIPLGHL